MSKKLQIIKNNKGETLIEVIMALTILSVVMIGSYVLTNRATRLTQSANERTEVSNIMRSQVEILKAWKQQDKLALASDTTEWDEILALSANGGSVTPNQTCKSSNNTNIAIPTRGNTASNPVPFILDTSNDSKNIEAINSSGVFTGSIDSDIDLYKIWIEGYAGSDSLNKDYVDFHVKACWERLGQNQVEESGSFVRINL